MGTNDDAVADGELAAQFEAFAAAVNGDASVPAAERLVRLAARTVAPADHAGFTIVPPSGSPRTMAATGELVARVDSVQYDAGEGPCLDAIEQHDVVWADDLAQERRWAAFTTRIVTETPVRSMFSVRLLLDPERGALNFYASRARAFTDADIERGVILASVASAALLAESRRRTIEHLEIAVRTNRDIGTAIGILMATRLITRDQAFLQLRQASQQLNRKLRDIAGDVIDTGTLPGP